MKVDERILTRLNELLAMSSRLLATRRMVSAGLPESVDSELSNQWGVSCLGLLSRVFGERSDHYKAFKNEFGGFYYFSNVKKATGILKAAQDDYEHGYLFEARKLIEAEVFDDFLEQASHLHDNGYDGPAAVVAGAVLEDGLRKICAKHGVGLGPKPKLDTMNAELAKANVYSLLVQKQITALADIRNNAAHGHWDKFTKEDVGGFISQVRTFMSTYLG